MNKPITIDCEYVLPEFAAAYLLVEDDEAAFVETNTTYAVPKLLKALEEAGRRPEDVRWVIVTHVHLDHAGGASALMKACPNATLLAHPRAARHLIDPSRLVASARQVYGDELFQKMYGDIEPIPAERVRIMEDEETLQWGSRTLRFLHTRGHANHHFVVHDSATDGIFSGDAFGLRYPMLQGRGLFVLPTTSPTDFDPDEAKKSVRRIAENGSRVYLTHYGEITEVAEAASQLLQHLEFSGDLLDEAIAREESGRPLVEYCERALRAHYQRVFEKRGLQLDEAGWKLLDMDLELNAQGIALVAEKRRAS